MIPADLLRSALITSGSVSLTQTIYAEDLYLSLGLLNNLLAQWQRKRWLVWCDVETSLVSTGAATYSVATGGDFDIARPDRIEAAFVRILGSGGPAMDSGLSIIEAREDWSQVALKSLSTFPAAVFYESTFPAGILHVWPIPPADAYEVHIVTKAPLPSALDLTTDIALPPEYAQALMFTLACMLRPVYGLPPDQTLQANMRGSLNTLRQANAQVATLGMPAGVSGRRGGGMAAGSSPSFQTGGW